MCTLKMPKQAQYMYPKQQILMKNLSVYNILLGRLQQNRRTKTANITKDDISSQNSDISAMCCEVMSSFVIFAVLVLRFCCSRPYKMLYKLSSFFINYRTITLYGCGRGEGTVFNVKLPNRWRACGMWSASRDLGT